MCDIVGKIQIWKNADQMALLSYLCQLFFPATSPRLWQQSLVPTHTLGKLQFQSWTKHSQIGMHEHSWQSCCTLQGWPRLIWLSCLESWAVTKNDDNWVSQRHHAKLIYIGHLPVSQMTIVCHCCEMLFKVIVWNEHGWNSSAANVCVPICLV